MPGRVSKDNSRDFLRACQDLQWTNDTNTLRRSETNSIAEGAAGRDIEGTATTVFRSGPSALLRGCAMECCSYLWKVHDKMPDVWNVACKTALHPTLYLVHKLCSAPTSTWPLSALLSMVSTLKSRLLLWQSCCCCPRNYTRNQGSEVATTLVTLHGAFWSLNIDWCVEQNTIVI